MNKSCVGCVFLYLHDRGYSNWTVEETDVACAQNRNPALPEKKPWDWTYNEPEGSDNWFATRSGRCELYANVGTQVVLDVDGETSAADQLPEYPLFAEVIDRHAGRS